MSDQKGAVCVEEGEASLLLSPVAHQMVGRVVEARLMLSSGLRCNQAVHAAGCGYVRLKEVPQVSSYGAAQPLTYSSPQIKTALRRGSVMLLALM